MTAPLDPVRLFRTLDDHAVEYVLIGGLAAVLHGSTAITNDADIFPNPDPENLQRLSDTLVEIEARIRSIDTPDGIPFDPHPTLLASMHMLNLTTTCGDLDIAFAPTAIADYRALAGASVRVEIEHVVVLVARLADIIASKKAANRSKDRAVLPILLALQEEIDRSP